MGEDMETGADGRRGRGKWRFASSWDETCYQGIQFPFQVGKGSFDGWGLAEND